MAKERNYNPVQAQRKADKAKAIKKGKADLQSKRNEKLAQRNPDRVQKQIDDLKAIQTSGGKLTSVEEQSLEALEKDLKAIKKAREALGDKAPAFGSGRGSSGAGGGNRDGNVLGKRRRDFDDASSDDSDVPDDVRRIPMPRDTPPPIPKPILDEWWAKRRAKRNANANMEPLKGNRLGDREGHQQDQSDEKSAPPPRPVVESKIVYEAKPMVRNLQKEAVSAFVPTTVRMKLDKGQGHGGLLEPEEADELERAGYMRTSTAAAAGQPPKSGHDEMQAPRHRNVTMEEVDDDEDEG